MLRRAFEYLAACLMTFMMIFVAACSPASADREPMTFDRDLFAEVLEHTTATGAPPVSFRSLTAFEWDVFYCYMDAVPADKVNAEVGHIILEPGTHFSAAAALAVFVKGDTVVKVTVIPELSMNPGRQPEGVMLDGSFLKAPDQVNQTTPTTFPAAGACPPRLAVCTMAPVPSPSRSRRSE